MQNSQGTESPSEKSTLRIPPRSRERVLCFTPQYFHIENQATDQSGELHLEVGGLIYCPLIQSIGSKEDFVVKDKDTSFYYGQDALFAFPLALFLFDTRNSQMYVSEISPKSSPNYPRDEFKGWFNPQFGADEDWVRAISGAHESVTLPAQALHPEWWDAQLEKDPDSIESFSNFLKQEFVRKRDIFYHPNYMIFVDGQVSIDKDKTRVKNLEYLKTKPMPTFSCIGPTRTQAFWKRLELARQVLDGKKVEEIVQKTCEKQNMTVDYIYSTLSKELATNTVIDSKIHAQRLLDAQLILQSRCASSVVLQAESESKVEDHLDRSIMIAQTDASAIEAIKIACLARLLLDERAPFELAINHKSVLGVPAQDESEEAFLKARQWIDPSQKNPKSLTDIEDLSADLRMTINLAVNFKNRSKENVQNIINDRLYGAKPQAYQPAGNLKDEGNADVFFYNMTSLLILKHLLAIKQN